MKDFRGKTAFITGGASGIGFALARAFGREGAQIALADIDFDAARYAVERLDKEQIKGVPVRCDVGERHSVERAALETIGAFGKVHIVCNNAGVAVGGPLGTITGSDWDWILDVNLKSVIYGVETFYPLIRAHGEGGHIVNTASVAGLLSPAGLEPYAATKFAVMAISEGWAQQLQQINIGMSVLCPGFVRTRIHESGRARPDRYGGKGEVDAGVGATQREAAENIARGLDPDIVGARTVEAVRAGEFYIFTHPFMRDVVEMRFQAIRSAFDAAAQSEVLKRVKEWTGPPSTLNMPPAPK
jgi:NAD(P)-dependent dehydrogenase (short-subunit alcohol dehydrogenase family)